MLQNISTCLARSVYVTYSTNRHAEVSCGRGLRVKCTRNEVMQLGHDLHLTLSKICKYHFKLSEVRR